MHEQNLIIKFAFVTWLIGYLLPGLDRLYKAALFETDTSKIPSRIEEARRVLVFRSRELFETSPNYDGETEAIETALYALQALENCLRSNAKDRRHAPRAS